MSVRAKRCRGRLSRSLRALDCVLVRSDNEAVVVDLDIKPVENPESVAWVDPIHKA